MLVYNTAGLVIGLFSLAVALGVDVAMGFGETEGVAALLAGSSVMAALGAGAEWRLAHGRRPRYFWVLPAWFVGLGGLGTMLYARVHAEAGLAVLGVALLGYLVHAVSELRKPGGYWLGVGITAVAVIAAETGAEHLLIEERVLAGKPVWGYPIRGGALVVLGYALYRLWRARRAARC